MLHGRTLRGAPKFATVTGVTTIAQRKQPIRELALVDPQVQVELAELRRKQKRFREAIELGRAIVSDNDVAITTRIRAFYSLGEAELALGLDQGLADLGRGLELARKSRERALQAEGYLRTGNARFLRQDFEDARTAYQMAASLYRRLGRADQVALCYRLLILLSQQVGRERDAEAFRQQAEDYFRSVGGSEWEAEKAAERS